MLLILPTFHLKVYYLPLQNTLSLGLLIFHVNTRSLNKNFGKLKDFLSELKKTFSEILLIERWSTDDKDSKFPRNKFSITLQFTNKSK